MFIKTIKIRTFFLLTSTLFLCECTTAVNPPPMATPIPVTTPKVENKKIANPYSKPTSSYLTQAKNQEGSEKQQSLIRAAGRLISEGQWRQGAAILAQTSDLTPAAMNEKIFYWRKLISFGIARKWH